MRKILLITTGGTIACPDTDESRSPENGAKRLLERIDVLPENVEITSTALYCRDSTDMSPTEWTDIARFIRDRYAQFNGFVITHGTDTLGYAAAALSCLIQNSEKPVVLTGSMLPMEAEKSDAPRNLADALAFAADEQSRGVVVAFDGKIIDGRCAVKIDTQSVSAFESVNEREMPIGKTRFFDKLDARIAVIRLVPGVEPPIVSDNTRAVLILGFGTGGLPGHGGWEKWLETLINRGVYIIMSTQVLRGGSDLRLYEVGSRLSDKYPIIDAGKMTAEYAAMRAMFALAYSGNFDEYRRVFLEQ